ncbi:MAG: hypothetical protein WA715_28305 [Candidatus Acidiferrum sp.]|jgi:hypothetical protein
MWKISATVVLAGALLGLATNVSAQTPPDIQKDTKSIATGTGTPAPVIAPLGVGTAFNASLDDTLDTRHTKAGDSFVAEAAEDVSYQNSMIFPKGTKITGHVVKVTSGGRGRTGSAIFVQFDKAVMKDGQEVILNAGIQALAAVASMPAESSKRATPAEAAPSNESADSSDALVVSTDYQAPQSSMTTPVAAADAPRGEFNSAGIFSADSKGAFGRPDLKVYTPTSEGSRGTVILSSKKNMHLDAGTHLLLVVQPPATGDGAESSGAAATDPDTQQ